VVKTRWFVLFALVAVLLAGSAWAHPPKDVILEFATDTQTLTVTAPHDTKDATKHFVGTIQVDLNGEKIIEQKMKSQMTAAEEKARFWIHDAKVGDTLTVTGTCNIAGKKSNTLKIEKVEKPKAAETKAGEPKTEQPTTGSQGK
jgi:desulfoferrodoxin (superoxide reductase-like protein)